jgi:hypothetical protein
MTRLSRNHLLQYLGTLRGSGSLFLQNGEQSLGAITYEIDGYCNHCARSANGQIAGEDKVLTQAFQAGVVGIRLSDGSSIEVVLADPHGGSTAEVQVNGDFPL